MRVCVYVHVNAYVGICAWMAYLKIWFYCWLKTFSGVGNKFLIRIALINSIIEVNVKSEVEDDEEAKEEY